MKVKGWSRFQHYTKRRPPWIKLHRDLLDDFAFSRLPLASQALAPRLWLIASESEDGTITDDVAELSFRLRCSEEDVMSGVNPLLSSGLLEGEQLASVVLAERKQNLTTEESRERGEKRQRIAPPSEDAGSFPSSRAADLFLKHYPQGTPPGSMFKVLRPLVQKHGWEVVAPEMEAYLEGTEISFHSWPKFAAGFGSWAKPKALAPRGGKLSGQALTEHNKSVLKSFGDKIDAALDTRLKS